ncbi:Protein of unknown function, partial [Gryllus bimaculatus]
IEPTILKRILQPWLYPDVVFSLTELGKQLKTLLKIMLETSEKIIQRKKSEFMIKEKESENGGHENGIGMDGWIYVNMYAGMDGWMDKREEK